MKQLSEYIKVLNLRAEVANAELPIREITFDSRRAGEGKIFVAVRGSKTDGHLYIPKAIEAGCRAVVCEELPSITESGISYMLVSDSSEALARLAAVHYDYPSSDIKVVGVTGTNGKTTVATLLYRLAAELGYKAGLLSTVANYVDKKQVEATHTTPDALTLQALLRQMVDAGCDYCFMEVSSHSVVQKRIAEIDFSGGIFTNITHDHLDYHLTFDAYLKAKKGFFDELKKDAFALVNADDRNAQLMTQNCKAGLKTFSLRSMADFRVKVIESLFEGMHLEIMGQEMWTPFIGRFNASNLAAVYGAGYMLKWKPDELIAALSKLRPVDGRFETIRSTGGITAVVDYAHTPDALQNIIGALNEIRGQGNSLITVVGAGGDRDPFKRPVMAAEAVKGSTKVILTSDNPRSENPETIIEQMMEGISFVDRGKVISITNRREAIRTACSIAKAGDVVLVAGKGHETYQEVNGVRTHFDDREVIKEFFEQQL
ncbi:MAG: UDP-N-acetylmuramoyl-L-alanyl-D-glutamate--2,6-diaminopimelate ligase [Bacteroidales bacterium]|nr:UDP-N-acetylmuramoyl-L-alanyl-D-glutamate--2,6-diaminopimelate ligase [Bacteroidales bacterium]